MDNIKLTKLTNAGFQVSSVQDFLQLSDDEIAEVDSRVEIEITRRALAELLKSSRGSTTQAEIATRINSTQPQVAKAESAAISVKIDYLFRANIAAGVPLHTIGSTIMHASRYALAKSPPQAKSTRKAKPTSSKPRVTA